MEGMNQEDLMEGMSREDLMEGMSQEDLMEGMSRDHYGVDEFVLDVLVLLAIAVCSACVLLLKLHIADIAPVLDFDSVPAVSIHRTKTGVLVGAVVLVMLLVLYKESALALAAWAARKGGNPMHILNSVLLSLVIVPQVFMIDSCLEEQEVHFTIPPYFWSYLLLVLVWWNDGTKPLMAILPVFGWSIVLMVILIVKFGWSIVLLQPRACILPFCWLTLLQGFLRIFDGACTATETCLFVWTLSYSCGQVYLHILLMVASSTSRPSETPDPLTLTLSFIIVIIGLWSLYRAAQLAWNIYLKVFAPLTWHMKEFLVSDLASMIVFTFYCSQISGHVAVLVGCAYLCVGWLLTGWFIYIFHMPHENQQELDQRLQTACKIGVAMDVGGKSVTYFFVFFRVHNTRPQELEFLEYFTTIVEAMIKFQHARRAHAREVTPGTLDRPLLDGTVGEEGEA